MSLVNVDSLGETIDAINEAHFFHTPLSDEDRIESARWIASRLELPGSYRGLFAPAARDVDLGVVLFTGEQRHSRGPSPHIVGEGAYRREPLAKRPGSTGMRTPPRATAGLSGSWRHILGEEACRALAILQVSEPAVCAVLARATVAVRAFGKGRNGPGYYCCADCTVAYWRCLNVLPIPDSHERIESGVSFLVRLRDGHGMWRRFPFYFTLLALVDIEGPLVTTELRYAAPACERRLQRPAAGDAYDSRRHEVLERVLASC